MLGRVKNSYLTRKWLEFMTPKILILTNTFTKICSKGTTIFFWSRVITLIYWGKHKYYKENTEALLLTSKETGLEVNAEKTKYVYVNVL
jgi:hypothetical protein